jgi:hypothetical protein
VAKMYRAISVTFKVGPFNFGGKIYDETPTQ